LLEDVGEIGPLLERGVDAVEVRQGVGFERIDPEDVAIGLLGLAQITELLLEDTRQPAADRTLHFYVFGVRTEHVGIAVRELLPAAIDRTGKPLDLFERPLVERRLLNRS